MCSMYNPGSIRIYENPATLQRRINVLTGFHQTVHNPLDPYKLINIIDLNEQAQVVAGSNFSDEVNWTNGWFSGFGPISINTGAGADIGNFGNPSFENTFDTVTHALGGINFGSGNDTLNLTVNGINNNVFFSGGLGDFTDTLKLNTFFMGKGQFVSNSDGSKTYVERDAQGTYNQYRLTGWEKVEIPSTTKKGETQVFSFNEFVDAVNKAYKPK